MKFFTFLLALLLPLTSFADLSEVEILNQKNQEIEEKLEEVRSEMLTLSEQLFYLDKKLEGEFLKKQLYTKKLEQLREELTQKIDEKSEIKNLEEVQKEEIQNLVLDFWREEQKFQSNGELNLISLFFSKFGIHISLFEKKVLAKFQNLRERKLVETLNEKLAKNEEIQEVKILKETISAIEKDLQENAKNLIQTKEAKDTLLAHYQNQEEQFQSQYEANKKAMLLSLLETKKALLKQSEFEKKIQAEEKKVKEIRKQKVIDPYDISRFETEGKKFIWPVDPDRGITATFLDSSYEEKFGIKHYAIDIRAKQATPVRAVANAFVYKVHDGGLDYSYLILAHKGSIQTVYGHLSEISVKEGQIVLQGDVIGLSGGLPGTPGAGNLTTGPHLHLEFHENGEVKNPLDFLEKNN